MAPRRSGLQLEGDMLVAPAPRAARLSHGHPVRRRRRGDHQQRAHPAREPARGRRQWRRDLPGDAGQAADLDPAAGSADLRPHGRDRWPRRSSASWCCRSRRRTRMIGIKPPIRRTRAWRRATRPSSTSCLVVARGQDAAARRAALRAPEDGVALPVVPPENNRLGGLRAGQVDRTRRRRRRHDCCRQAVADFVCAAARPLPPRRRKSNDADGPVTSVQFDVGWYSDGSADTPDRWRPRSTSRNTCPATPWWCRSTPAPRAG